MDFNHRRYRGPLLKVRAQLRRVNLNLQSGGNIGTSTAPLLTQATTFQHSYAGSTGSIYITNTGATNLGDINTHLIFYRGELFNTDFRRHYPIHTGDHDE